MNSMSKALFTIVHFDFNALLTLWSFLTVTVKLNSAFYNTADAYMCKKQRRLFKLVRACPVCMNGHLMCVFGCVIWTEIVSEIQWNVEV